MTQSLEDKKCHIAYDHNDEQGFCAVCGWDIRSPEDRAQNEEKPSGFLGWLRNLRK